jgi:HPt (histidine-containing phosphotransfer) domain-containing protein
MLHKTKHTCRPLQDLYFCLIIVLKTSHHFLMSTSIDLTFLKGFTSGNQEKIKKYIGMFLQLCPNSLEAMKTAVDHSDYDALRAAAHSIKPQITYMGIKSGEPLVKTIEELAASKNEVEKLPAMVQEFDAICRQAMVELSAAIS